MISIPIIFHYKTDDLTNKVISQLESLPKIIVYDDGSEESFATHQPNVKVTREQENKGYLKSVNVMMKTVEIESFLDNHTDLKNVFVWHLNSDVTGLTPELFYLLAKTLQEHPELAVVSPSVKPSPHKDMQQGKHDFRYVKHVDWVAPMVRACSWFAVNGFDENLKGYGCDLDICYRLRQQNWKLAVLPNKTIQHEMGGTVKTLPIEERKQHDDLEFMDSYLCQKYQINNWKELQK